MHPVEFPEFKTQLTANQTYATTFSHLPETTTSQEVEALIQEAQQVTTIDQFRKESFEKDLRHKIKDVISGKIFLQELLS